MTLQQAQSLIAKDVQSRQRRSLQVAIDPNRAYNYVTGANVRFINETRTVKDLYGKPKLSSLAFAL